MSPETIGYLVSVLILLGILGGWGWKVANWLMDIKADVKTFAGHVEGVRTEHQTLKASDSELWQQIAWLKGRIGEPLERLKP